MNKFKSFWKMSTFQMTVNKIVQFCFWTIFQLYVYICLCTKVWPGHNVRIHLRCMLCQQLIAPTLSKHHMPAFIILISVRLIFIQVALKIWVVKILTMPWTVVILYFKNQTWRQEKRNNNQINHRRLICLSNKID